MGFAILAAIGLHGAAQAQPAASQVTPRSLRPEPAPPTPPPAIELPPGAPNQAPKGSETLHVAVAKVVVDGAYPDMAAAARKLFKPFENQRASIADLYKASSELERAYIGAGYALARVAVPKQTILDGGEFHVVLIDGFIEAIDDSKVPGPVRGPIHAIMQGLVGRHRIKTAVLQEALTRAGAVSGAHLRSTLAQGDTPGGARLVLDGG